MMMARVDILRHIADGKNRIESVKGGFLVRQITIHIIN
jgi:hypothetical protein